MRVRKQLLKGGLYRPEFEHDSCGVGFVAHIGGKPSHEIISWGIEILVNLTHRGAVADDPETGDGAGILIQVGDSFFREKCAELGIKLPDPGSYGVGMVFLPRKDSQRSFCEWVLDKLWKKPDRDFWDGAMFQ